MSTCAIEGCDKPCKTRGQCAAHDQAMRRASDPTYNRFSVACVTCGKQFWSKRKTGKLCSNECRRKPSTLTLLPTDHPVRVLAARSLAEAKAIRECERRSHLAKMDRGIRLREAYELGDHPRFLALIRSEVVVDHNGCWNWQRDIKNGYGRLVIRGRKHEAHRVVLEVKLGKPLGKQAAHHACANTRCVNPDHLQPVTARENNAEMLARTYMQSRITDLESALAQHAPNHPLLQEVGVITAA